MATFAIRLHSFEFQKKEQRLVVYIHSMKSSWDFQNLKRHIKASDPCKLKLKEEEKQNNR